MGYHVSIVRTNGGKGNPITEQEVIDFASKSPGFRIEHPPTPKGPCTVVVYSRDGRDICDLQLDERDGLLWTKNPENEELEIMLSIATTFGGSKSIALGAAGLGAWLGNPKEAAADFLQTAFKWSPFSDVWEAVEIKDAGAGSAFYGPGTPYPTYQDFSRSQGLNTSAAGGGFLLYPNKANTNMMQSVYSK